MPVTAFPVELTDARATLGRKVSVNVPVGYPAGATAAALSSATARARQKLQALVGGGAATLDPFPDGSGADVGVTGSLRGPWTSVWGLRKAAYDAVQAGGAEAGIAFAGFGPEDVGLVDLEAPPVEKFVHGPDSGYFDPTGEITGDGALSYASILDNGAQQGLENFGRGVGKVGEAVGSGVASATGGFFGGLGTGGTVVFLLLLAGAAILVLAYVFGPAFFMGGA